MDSPSSKRVLACIRCSHKRVKCNRQKPCSTCVKHNSECEYRLRKQRKKRQATADEEENDAFSKKLETSASIGRENELIDERDAAPPPAAIESHGSQPQTTIFKPQLLTGEDSARLVDNSLWSRIAEEVHGEDESSDDPASSGHDQAGKHLDEETYVFGVDNNNAKLIHPTPDKILRLWTLFVDNVDPLFKITHIPSLQSSIEKSISNLDRIPKPFEALMFSIYSMAVISITDEECRKLIEQPREHCLERFVSATRSALVRAKFLSSTSLVTMQALTLHLFSIRQSSEPRAVWNLTGLAFRIAQGMGLCIDGTLLGLSPFETEMRRRLWWQLKSHDFQAAELCGQSRFRQFEIDETTPKIPANVNDVDLYPSMIESPKDSKSITEMVWNVLRAELSTFASSHNAMVKKMKRPNPMSALRSEEFSASDDMSIKDEICDEIETLAETKYLRYCDASKPLQLLTLLGARCATDYVRFVAHHPRRWAHQRDVPQTEKLLIWTLCLQILDRTIMMKSLPQLQRFAWITPYFIQWPVVIHVLDTLRSEPGHPDASKAWNIIDGLFESNLETLLMKRPIFVAVSGLCLKAYYARVRPGSDASQVPTYIARLEKHQQDTRNRGRAKARKHHLSSTQIPEHLQQSHNTLPITASQPGVDSIPQFAQSDSFWLNGGLEQLPTSETPGSFDLDIEANGFIGINESFENDMMLNWEQWDAWLGNTNKK